MRVKEKTKQRRFLKLLKNFRELPEERFDLGSWVGTEVWRGTWDDNGLPTNFLTENPCGTTGCLAGWTVAWFPRSWKYSVGSHPVLKSPELGPGLSVASYMAEFFGGTVDDWVNIIYPSNYGEGAVYGVPKRLVMERLTDLYSKLYKK